MGPRATSVRHLQNLYAVVVAVALTVAVERSLPEAHAVETSALPLFVALLATLIPFYQGTLRHLDSVYIEGTVARVRDGALLLDFFALFLESCVFLGLAASVARPWFFAWSYLTLLTIDIVWTLVTTTALSASRTNWAQLRWLRVNLITVPILAVLLSVLAAIGWDNNAVKIVILPIALLRTAADYATSWRFYTATETD